MLIRILPPWHRPERAVTDEAHWLDRRQFIQAAAATALVACSADDPGDPLRTTPPSTTRDLYPAPSSPGFSPDLPVTPERIAASYNNFYEFTPDKASVWKRVGAFQVRPWALEIGGLCANPATVDFDRLARMFPLVARTYRFRCVEAWAMVVPWTGFALADLVKWARPTADARYVKLTTARLPAQMPGLREQPWYPWPYYEALTLAEATHPLTLMATGIYGHELPKQHGAPIRLVVPWKYGYKNIKSVARIEFTAQAPGTFWNALVPNEYGTVGNVNPRVPHPRWSQATERMIGTGARVPTLAYNGYADQVAALYPTG